MKGLCVLLLSLPALGTRMLTHEQLCLHNRNVPPRRLRSRNSMGAATERPQRQRRHKYQRGPSRNSDGVDTEPNYEHGQLYDGRRTPQSISDCAIFDPKVSAKMTNELYGESMADYAEKFGPLLLDSPSCSGHSATEDDDRPVRKDTVISTFSLLDTPNTASETRPSTYDHQGILGSSDGAETSIPNIKKEKPAYMYTPSDNSVDGTIRSQERLREPEPIAEMRGRAMEFLRYVLTLNEHMQQPIAKAMCRKRLLCVKGYAFDFYLCGHTILNEISTFFGVKPGQVLWEWHEKTNWPQILIVAEDAVEAHNLKVFYDGWQMPKRKRVPDNPAIDNDFCLEVEVLSVKSSSKAKH